jgi:hypothetical protein
VKKTVMAEEVPVFTSPAEEGSCFLTLPERGGFDLAPESFVVGNFVGKAPKLS